MMNKVGTILLPRFVSNNCWMSGKECRSGTDPTESSSWVASSVKVRSDAALSDLGLLFLRKPVYRNM